MNFFNAPAILSTTTAPVVITITPPVVNTTPGNLYTAGAGGWYQLGNGNNGNSTPLLAKIGTSTWKNIGQSVYGGLGVRSDGTLWSWGSDYGMQGTAVSGAGTQKTVPGQVGTATTWKQVAATSASGFGIRTDGTLWAWGSNVYGQLGKGTTNASSTVYFAPAQIGTDTNWMYAQHQWGIGAWDEDKRLDTYPAQC